MALDHQLGVAAVIRGDAPAAFEIAARNRTQATTLRGRARAFNLQALVEGEFGDSGCADECFQAALDIDVELGDINSAMIDHSNVAETAMRAGDTARAARHQRQSLDIARQLGNELIVAFSMIIAARLAAQVDRWDDSIRLHAHAVNILTRLECRLYPSDQALSDQLLRDARAAVGADAFDALDHEGGSSTATDAIELADAILMACSGEVPQDEVRTGT